MPERAALSPREGLKIGLGLTMAGPQWVQPWEGGRRGLSHWHESWVRVMGSESSHEDDVTVGPVMSHGGSSHESRWVQLELVYLVAYLG